MPGGNRTGPRGAGPMSGKAAGYCAGYPVPGYANSLGGYGRGGRGWGRGHGRCWGRYWYAYPPNVTVQPIYPQVIQPQAPEQEVASLENYQKDLAADKADLEKEMDDVKTRIDELKAKVKK